MASVMFWRLVDDFRVWLSRAMNGSVQVHETSLPKFSNVQDVWDKALSKARWTGDPLNGQFDFSITPEKLQTCINNPKFFDSIPVDCDDFACYAYKAINSIPGYKARMRIIFADKVSHAICTFEGNSSGSIDNTGLYYMTPSDANVLSNYSKVFGYKYNSIDDMRYPFAD